MPSSSSITKPTGSPRYRGPSPGGPVAGRVIGVDHRHLQPACVDRAALVHADDLDSRAVQLRLQPKAELVDAWPGGSRSSWRSSARRHRSPVAGPIRGGRNGRATRASRRTRSTASAALGDVGLPNHGSRSTTFPPGVRSSTQECPYQVNVASATDLCLHLTRQPMLTARCPHSGVPRSGCNI